MADGGCARARAPHVDLHDAHARPGRATRSSTKSSSCATSASSRRRPASTDEALLELGRFGDKPGFGMTPFALRLSAYANGVSDLHGEVAREMWASLWPGEETPIGHVTNGVHIGTWLDPALGELLRYAGVNPGGAARRGELGCGAGRRRPKAIWRVHAAAKARLAERAGHRPRPADDRLRPPLRDLQARRARLLRHRAPARAADPDRRRRQGPPRRHAGQGRDAGDHRARAGAARPGPRRLPRELRHGCRPGDGARLRRLAEHAAPPARGVGDERHEGRDQRRPQSLGARRLVGGGLLARRRLGDRGLLRRGRSRAALPAARGGGRADVHRQPRALGRDDAGVDRPARAALLDAPSGDRVRRALLPAGPRRPPAASPPDARQLWRCGERPCLLACARLALRRRPARASAGARSPA